MATIFNESIITDLHALGKRATIAALTLQSLPDSFKKKALRQAADTVQKNAEEILKANEFDIKNAKNRGLSKAVIERLSLNHERITGIVHAIRNIAELSDPVGRIIETRTMGNGLIINRVNVPLGVLGVIYEARPNVTTDAAALAIKSGNAVILRSGTASFFTSKCLADSFSKGLSEAGIPAGAVSFVQTTDRDAVGIMLTMDKYIDVVIPRGGRSLVERIAEESRIPLLKHLDGICHTYIHTSANAELAKNVVLNAKMRRTNICGATETLLIDAGALYAVKPLINALIESGCTVKGDSKIQRLDERIIEASEEDWCTEYLDALISVKVVDGVDAAVEHINGYGSHHTDAIIAEDIGAVNTFMANVNSAICMHNASTQFADGGEFGMGAEIGISTGKLHARGPVGVEQLTTYKYQVYGNGQCRS